MPEIVNGITVPTEDDPVDLPGNLRAFAEGVGEVAQSIAEDAGAAAAVGYASSLDATKMRTVLDGDNDFTSGLTASTAQSIEPGETDPQAAVDARAARLGGPRTNKIVLLGNSRLERDYSDNGTSVYNSAKGIFTWANARLGGRFDVVKYAGVAGETLAEMADRCADDVAAYSPAWVLLADAVNDATNNRTTAQMIADTEAIIDLCRSIGARPIILTAPPNNSHSSGQRSALLGWNRWVKQYPDPFVVPVDVAEPVTDAAGAYSTWYAEDGLHQSRAGAMRMGRVLAESLAPIVPPLDPFPSSPLDPTIFTLNPWMNGVSGSGVAANWTSSGTATFTKVVRNEGQATVWNEIEKTTTGTVFLQQTRSPAPAGMVAGVRVRLLFEMEIDDASTLGDLSAQVQLRNSSSSPIVTLAALAAWGTTTVLGDLPTGEPIVLSSPAVELPSGFHNFNFFLSFIGLGTVRVGRIAIVKVD